MTCRVMADNTININAGADQSGAPVENQGRSIHAADPFTPPGVLTGKPTIAAIGTAEIPRSLRKTFQMGGELLPEWMRLPAPGSRDPMTGLSRTSLNEAVDRRDIKSITVRQPGATRGIKLLHVGSVRAWLSRLDTEQNPAGDGTHA